ncbi:MAG: hypothetical protein OEV66_10570 [Spirochaetia bacterium]|nr:hypothetical protein [Spirochaetia bacterium]
MKIQITQKANKELLKLGHALNVELELYFSCLIRKRVLFREQALPDAIGIPSNIENLAIQFRPVMTKACLIGDLDEQDTAVEKFPIVRAERFFPKWFKLDYKKGKWNGEFGYDG